MGQLLSAIFLENKMNFRVCLDRHWNDFPETSISHFSRIPANQYIFI